MAFATGDNQRFNQGTSSNHSSQMHAGGYKKNNLLCDHCKMTNHTVDKCYKLKGYPPRPGYGKFAKGKRVAAVVYGDDDSDTDECDAAHISKDQFSQFLTYIKQNKADEAGKITGMANMADLFDSHVPFDKLPNKIIVADGKKVEDSQKSSLVIGNLESGLYAVDKDHAESSSSVNLAITEEAKLLHLRLGYLPFNKLHYLNANLPTKCCIDIVCQICPLAKQTRKPFPVSSSKSNKCFDLLHIDVWGPYKSMTHDHCTYFLTIVDDMSRHTWTFLMRNKTDSVDILEYLFTLIHNQFEVQVKSIRTDNAKELCEGKILSVYEKFGIFHQTSCVDTPQQNGVVERKHRHLLETARDVTFHEKHFPFHFSHSTQTPDSIFLPANTPFNFGTEFDVPDIFVQNTDTDSGTGQLDFSEMSNSTLETPTQNSTQTQTQTQNNNQTPYSKLTIPERQSTRPTKKPSWMDNYICVVTGSPHWCNLVSFEELHTPCKALITAFCSHTEPATYFEASQHPEWVAAMNKELEALAANGTWEVTDLPSNWLQVGVQNKAKKGWNNGKVQGKTGCQGVFVAFVVAVLVGLASGKVLVWLWVRSGVVVGRVPGRVFWCARTFVQARDDFSQPLPSLRGGKEHHDHSDHDDQAEDDTTIYPFVQSENEDESGSLYLAVLL
ncbi:uncharacterized protein LOC110706507 [Chenopodium quinoa]|uniref:uncharacterized protein LOC110706507 n=1 Tax=Chenopodium quinoa TaxID=63459 RepID=UPI000B78DD1B|nr:uncharacterized protein LOC110706507 [Chenopodium quinoa]